MQGVGFRVATLAEGRRRNLVGWVRNVPDGSVEVLICGPADRVEDLERWLRHGPPGARVDKLRELPFSGEEAAVPRSFDIRA